MFGTVDTGKGWHSQVCPHAIGCITTCHKMRHSQSLQIVDKLAELSTSKFQPFIKVLISTICSQPLRRTRGNCKEHERVKRNTKKMIKMEFKHVFRLQIRLPPLPNILGISRRSRGQPETRRLRVTHYCNLSFSVYYNKINDAFPIVMSCQNAQRHFINGSLIIFVMKKCNLKIPFEVTTR